MMAQRERRYDDYERMADAAMMNEIAHRAKKPKRADLFKRPVDETEAEKKAKVMMEQAEHASDWLAQFEFN